jgi:hypothetical protein
MTEATSTADVLTINGTGLFVDVRGPEDAPPLLFVHGGKCSVDGLADATTGPGDVGEDSLDDTIHVVTNASRRLSQWFHRAGQLCVALTARVRQRCVDCLPHQVGNLLTAPA